MLVTGSTGAIGSAVVEVASVEETPAPLWTETLAVNVVFVNAAPGLHAVPRWSAYAASKAALTELADSLRTVRDQSVSRAAGNSACTRRGT
ncbi:hypothetical protein GCM10009557_26170 [Virgisporangium ochraceum]|uniref:Uncharacterized protein n=2 Tax=Virgisporangium ochraceum TaxID=65505 RepID=A0A8J4E813_9ACTN|nr:hypothetical protein Voc01_000430 [Virgisporangium ochraceum]